MTPEYLPWKAASPKGSQLQYYVSPPCEKEESSLEFPAETCPHSLQVIHHRDFCLWTEV